LFKWLLVPFSILTVTGAAASLSLYEDWDSVVKLQGYKKNVNDWILFVVLFGYFGSNPGLIVHALGHIGACILAAVMTLIGYIGLGVCATYSSGSPYHLGFTLLFLYLACLASSLAIVSTVSETIQDFSKRSGHLYIVLMIVYFLICYSYEESLRNGVLRSISTEYYYPFLGVGIAIIYLATCILSRYVIIEEFYQRINISEDIIGMFTLLLISSMMIIINYICYLTSFQYSIYFGVFTAILIINFIAAFIIIKISYRVIESNKPVDEFIEVEDRVINTRLWDALQDRKLYSVLLGTFIIIGTTQTFLKNIGVIKITLHNTTPSATLENAFLLSQTLGAILCGIFGFFFKFRCNKFLLGTIGAGMAILGFISILFLNCLFIPTILIGTANGVWWVMAPIIAYGLFGPKPFDAIWGSILTVNFWGMFAFGLIFQLFWESRNDYLTWSIAIFCVAIGFAILILQLIFRRTNEDGENTGLIHK
jgi:hypothetical protein